MDPIITSEVVASVIQGVAKMAYLLSVGKEEALREFESSYDELVKKDANKLPEV